MVETLVEIDGLEIKNADTRLLSSGSLMVRRGACMAIFGPGGSGKSLFLKFINNIRPEELNYRCDKFLEPVGSTFYLDRNKKKIDPPIIPEGSYDLYLIDEPENGYSIEEFQEFFRKIQAASSTLVFVTHHLEFLQHFADEIMVLKYGESKGTFAKNDFFNNDDPYIDYLSKMGC